MELEDDVIEQGTVHDGGDCPACESSNTEIVFCGDKTGIYRCGSCGFEITMSYQLATLH